MNEALKMQISAFVDGELPANEAELLLRRLSQDALMRQQVAEYLEIGRLMRRDRAVAGIESLRSRIAATLGDEETLVETSTERVVGSGLMTPAGGIAIAATVAVVALLGLSQITDRTNNPRLDEAVAIDRAPTYTEPTADQILLNQPDDRLRDYLRRHEDSYPQTGYRTAAFEIDEGLERIEPDEHLATEADAENADARDVPGQDGAASQ